MYQPPPPPRTTQPDINYLAPELVVQPGCGTTATPAVDIFALGAVLYELFTHTQLLPCGPNDVMGYRSRVSALGLADMHRIPAQLQPLLRGMISPSAHARPSALSFAGSAFFQDDPQLRALRFLDNMLSRDNLAKAAFLKDLSNCWDAFDSRVLRYKVLPPLLQELRNEALQTLVLPLVIRIVQQQSKQDFMDFTLPALKPICDNAKVCVVVVVVGAGGAYHECMCGVVVSFQWTHTHTYTHNNTIPHVPPPLIPLLSPL